MSRSYFSIESATSANNRGQNTFTIGSSSQERNTKCWFSQATFGTSSKTFFLLKSFENFSNLWNLFLVVPNSSPSRYGRCSSGILLSSSRSLLWSRSDSPIQTNTSRSNEKFSTIALLALSPFVSISSKFSNFTQPSLKCFAYLLFLYSLEYVCPGKGL